MSERKERKKPAWEASAIRALRRHMKLSQERLAAELGTRQQTVSEWETGRYRPRGASATLLTIIAERAEFEYGAGKGKGERNRNREQRTGNREQGTGNKGTSVGNVKQRSKEPEARSQEQGARSYEFRS